MAKEQNDDELIEVYSSSPLEAQMVNSLLQDAEIDTFIKDELMGSIAPWYVAGGGAGAFHSSDLWYIFHSFRHSWRPFNSGDEALSQKMLDFWTNFARYGNPNGNAETVWPAYTNASPKFMVLDVDGEEATFSMTDTPEFKRPASLR